MRLDGWESNQSTRTTIYFERLGWKGSSKKWRYRDRDRKRERDGPIDSELLPPPGHRHCWLVQPTEWHTVGKADPLLFKGNNNNLGCWHLEFAPLNLLVTVALISPPRLCRTIRRSEDAPRRTPESPRRTRWSRHRGQQIGFYALCALDVWCSVSVWPLEKCEWSKINCGDTPKKWFGLKMFGLNVQ